jgi:hypothetical protein
VAVQLAFQVKIAVDPLNVLPGVGLAIVAKVAQPPVIVVPS